MSSYTLTSVKGTQTANGTIEQAFRAALDHEETMQPAYGVTIECSDGRTFECRDGKIAVCAEAGEDSEEGNVMLRDDELVIAWHQGTMTAFFDADLVAA